MIVGDEFDFISGVIASDVVFDDVLNNAFISFVCAGELVPVEHLVGVLQNCPFFESSELWGTL